MFISISISNTRSLLICIEAAKPWTLFYLLLYLLCLFLISYKAILQVLSRLLKWTGLIYQFHLTCVIIVVVIIIINVRAVHLLHLLKFFIYILLFNGSQSQFALILPSFKRSSNCI